MEQLRLRKNAGCFRLRGKLFAGVITLASILAPLLSAPGVSAASADGAFLPDGEYTIWVDSWHFELGPVRDNAEIIYDEDEIYREYSYNPATLYLTRGSDGTYTIKNMEGKALDVAGGSWADGANVQFWTPNGTCAQKWIFKYMREDSVYVIKNACSGKVVDVSGGVITRSGTNIQMWRPNGTKAQAWTVQRSIRSSLGSRGLVSLRTQAGRALDIAGGILLPGINTWIWAPNGTVAQTFQFKLNFDGSVYIRDKTRLLALDVAGASKANGANVQMWVKNDTCAQRWFPEREDYTSNYVFLSSCSGKALDVSGGAIGRSGTNVQIWTPNGTAAQKWYVK